MMRVNSFLLENDFNLSHCAASIVYIRYLQQI